ncbi:Fe-S cluster assembly protein SufD [Flavobacteriaceae bacterium]|jgi:Fe-S cluster assembly protein SufD|nr:Fe-S cluster assembly protein SufD [Flavobacteriaceae bacterium]MDB4093471.1 Fe-S cluster assembly protein SufD [Flavobacteriaceae bacterium]MDB9994856.1 Fe-S cluster assembly protein SufD [Flavobacteriaceae bacterium]MDC1456747.1 Fe-S cluster assembly protein SufD [Flavobacteriaceae bacterium]|tara:strand:- start:772 stop:2088 length:1317 start_codon:yes stop_codon:yes gene_type:complete
MSLQEKLISSFLAFELDINIQSPVHNIRTRALKEFEKLGFPNKKLEAWKYTSLKNVLKEDYTIFSKKKNVLEFKNIQDYFIDNTETYKLVFVDGSFDPFLSQTSHDGVDICILSAALTKPVYSKVISKYFDSSINKKDSLSLLNTAFSKEGVYIHIPKNKVLEKPVEVIHFATGNEAALMLQPRNLIVLEENSQAEIIETHQSLTDNPIFTNCVTEIFVGENAHLDYYKIQNDKLTSSLIDNTYISQEKKSIAKVHTFSFGGKLTRNNLNYFQKGSYIDSIMKGITIIDENQLVDHHTLVDHAKPNCESHQDYKGIYSGKSTGVFNGKIVVDKIAQKTNAFQKNNNILLTDKSTINSKPQLEIFADDVKCSHGCTIGQLDQDALFYLRARGIPKKEAEALLTFAFANNVLESVNIPSVKSRIKKIIANKLGVDLGFDL